jgi:hypothetical protein
MRLAGPALVIALIGVLALLSRPEDAFALTCQDFANQQAAQNHLRSFPWDPDRLDGDNNGVACDIPEPSLRCPCDITPVIRTVAPGGTLVASAGTPIPTVSGGLTTVTPIPTATVTATAPAPGTGRFVGTPSGTTLTCPRSGEWLGLYWNGGPTAVATAVRTCPTADRVWSRRGREWRGYATEAAGASDQFNVEIGEFVFVHGR